MPGSVSALGPGFDGVLDELRRCAADIDRSGRAPRRFIDELKGLGFGRLRIPADRGGLGATAAELLEAVRLIAAAEPSVAQSWRTHILAVERHVKGPPGPSRERWLDLFAAGAMLGGGWTEADGSGPERFTTRLERAPDGSLSLTGRKFYSTGSLYADWVECSAVDDAGRLVIVGVRADAPGLELRDDWTGFGQRATGSGTMVLDGVPVDEADVMAWSTQHRGTAGWQQLVLLAVLAGIAEGARDAARDIIALRERAQGPASVAVLERYGRLSALAFAAHACLSAAATAADRAHEATVARTPDADALADDAEIASFQAQLAIVPQAHEAGDLVVDIARRLHSDGPDGAEAVRRYALDRFWRNARTVSTHNPVAFRARTVADADLHALDRGAHFDVRERLREAAVARAADRASIRALRLSGPYARRLAQERPLRRALAIALAEREPALLVVAQPDAPDGLDASVVIAALLPDLPQAWFAVEARGISALGHPYNFARRMASLDQLSGGRMAWALHDDGDERTAGYVTVVQQLWRSWPRESLAADRTAPAFAEVRLIRRIGTTDAYGVAGPLNVPSSPQYLPVTAATGALARPGPHSHIDLVLAESHWSLPGANGTPPAVSVLPQDVAAVEDVLALLPGPSDGHPIATLRERLALPIPLLEELPGAGPRFTETTEPA